MCIPNHASSCDARLAQDKSPPRHRTYQHEQLFQTCKYASHLVVLEQLGLAACAPCAGECTAKAHPSSTHIGRICGVQSTHRSDDFHAISRVLRVPWPP